MLQVNTDGMYQMGHLMGRLSVRLTDLGVSLGDLNTRAESFIANWVTHSGRSATGMILGSRMENEQLTQNIGTLCIKLAKAADGYLGAEQAALDLMKQYESGLPSGWAVNEPPTIGGNFMTDVAKDKVFGAAESYANKAESSGGVLSYVAAKALFGAERYMDVKANRGNPYGLAQQSKISELLLKSFDAAGAKINAFIRGAAPGADDYLRSRGVVRELDHSEVITDQEVLVGIDELVVPQTPADFAHNEWVLSQLDDNVDTYMAGQGRVVKYQGVVVQLIENADGVQTAIVYVSGTDSPRFANELNGEPATWTADVGEVVVDPDNPLSEGTASMQLVEEALKHAGVPEGIGLIMAGFSKGGATAYNFAHNKEMQAKYEMKGIYDQAGPTGGLKSSGKDIPHIKVMNKNDIVSYAGGDYTEEQHKNMHEIHIDSETVGLGEDTHGYDIYYETAQADPEMNAKIAEFQEYTAGAHQVGDATLVAGSTLPADTTQEELNVYRGTVGAAVLYDVANVAEEFLPQEVNAFGVSIETRIPNVPDLPTVVTDENTVGDYFEAGYKLVTGEDFDSTPPTLNLSPDHFAEQEKPFEFTAGSEDGPHIDVKVDGGVYDIDIDWDGEDGGVSFVERTWEAVAEQFPDVPEGWNEKPLPGQWEKPGYSQPVEQPQGGGITFTPVAPELAGVGGNF